MSEATSGKAWALVPRIAALTRATHADAYRSGELWFRDTPVCALTDVFCHQKTFFGKVRPLIREFDGALQRRLLAFIAFSVDWNRRAEDHRSEPPDPSEFDAFEELIGPTKWRAKLSTKNCLILDAPAFFGPDEVSWVEL